MTAPVPSTRPARVVIVDDHVMFGQTLSRFLSEQPTITVVALAGSGAGALEAVRRHEPDVVLLDNALPDGVGTEVARQVLAIRPGTKLVMLTASEDEEVLLAAIQAGCAGYVTKLDPAEQVIEAVHAAYAGETVMPAAMLARLLPRLTRQEQRPNTQLTKRELDVLELMVEGLANAAIAERLYLSTHTVRNHVQNILVKLEAHSKLEAVSIAVRTRLIKYP